MADAVTVVTSLVAGGAAGAVVTALTSTWRERVADARVLRDRRAERLRQAFKPVLFTAQVRAEVIHQQKFVFGQTTEQRDAWLLESLQRASEGLSEARLALKLEPDAGHNIDELFQETWRAYVDFQSLMQLREDLKGQGPQDQRPKLTDISAKEKIVQAATDRLGDAMLAVLRDAERPLPIPWRSRVATWWGGRGWP